MFFSREFTALRVFIVLSWLAVLFLVGFSRIEVDYLDFKLLYQIAGVAYAIAFLSYWRNLKYIGECLELVGAGLLLTVPVVVSTYLAMALDFPLADDELMRMDNALGFDWHWFISLIDGSKIASTILQDAYTSFSLQLIAMPIILTLIKQTERAIAYIFGYGLLCFISSFVAIWYPALGTYTLYEVSPNDLANINAHFGFFFLDDFNSLRSGEPFVLNVEKVAGIITFPSVHAGVAFLTIWAAWRNKWIRWPFFILNILMAISAISHANHYLIDIVAGFGIAGLTVTIVSYIVLNHRFNFRFADLKPIHINKKLFDIRHAPKR